MLNSEELTKWTSSETLAHERHLTAGWIIILFAYCSEIYKAFAYIIRCHLQSFQIWHFINVDSKFPKLRNSPSIFTLNLIFFQLQDIIIWLRLNIHIY